jgi:uncharacterized membrane protein YdjX (TVP38/TMEM64 family)
MPMTRRELLARRLRQGHLWRRVAATGLVTALLVAVVKSDALHAGAVELVRVVGDVMARHEVAGRVVFVLFSAGSAMLAFVSSAVLVPSALVAWGPIETAVLLWLGWTLGGCVAYGLARQIGRPIVALLSSGTTLARWEARIPRTAPFTVVALFQLAMPSEVPGYVLGFVRYSFLRYLLVLALGELPWAFGTVAVGAGFLGRHTALLLALGALGVAASLFAFRALHRRLNAAAASGER